MKLSLEKSPFLKALSHGQSVVEKRTTIPILGHILLSATSEGLSFTSTDMDLALVENIPAEVQEPGSICVSAHLLHEIVRKLSDKFPIDISFDSKTSQLIISSGRSQFNLSCLPAEDFPQLTHISLSHHFTLPAPLFKHLIDSTRFAMSSEETRYHLNGIYFHSFEQEGNLVLRAVATDMHRLACIHCDAPDNLKDMPGIIVGRKAISEIRKLLDEAEKPIEIGLSSTRIEISMQGAQTKAILSSRLIDGNFPEYQAALNVDNDKILLVNRKVFAEAVDRVGTVVTDKIRAIRMKLSENMAILSAVSNEYGSAIEELDVDFPYKENIEICFNVRYLTDIAQQIDTEEMELLLHDGDSSVLVKPLNQDDAVFILMPMRI